MRHGILSHTNIVIRRSCKIQECESVLRAREYLDIDAAVGAGLTVRHRQFANAPESFGACFGNTIGAEALIDQASSGQVVN